MRSRRCYAFLLLLVVALTLASPLLADDACDDRCGSHCGDCASCPLFAELHGPPASVDLISAVLAPHGESDSRAGRPRTLDHVPLLRR